MRSKNDDGNMDKYCLGYTCTQSSFNTLLTFDCVASLHFHRPTLIVGLDAEPIP